MSQKILICGLPGAGKTTLAKELAKILNAVHFNADEIRSEINKDLGFSLQDRLEQARRMSVLCDIVVRSNQFAIADFVCPTIETRKVFGVGEKDVFVVWVDRIKNSRFADTNKLFEPLDVSEYNVVVDGNESALYWANLIKRLLIPYFNPKGPTALLIGRYQPFHDGHKQLIIKSIERVGQVCIGVRDTHGTDQKNPLEFFEVEQSIRKGLVEYEGKYTIIQVPNITNIFYGRDVGYKIEEIILDKDTQNISATNIRKELKI